MLTQVNTRCTGLSQSTTRSLVQSTAIRALTPISGRPLHSVKCRAAATAEDKKTEAKEALKQAKEAFLEGVRYTGRGSLVTREQKGSIEELQVALETFQAGSDLDYTLLGGLWELEYTTASDVLPIIEADRKLRGFPITYGPSLIQARRIFQRFTSPVDGVGKVENIIEFTVPFLLEEKKGVTFTVQASYEVRSGHRIRLVFNALNISDVRISEGLEAFLAPAILPRNPLQHALLLAIKQFNFRLPFRTPQQMAAGIDERTGRTGSGGGSFHITYLDEDLLVGRATEMSGIFVLKRVTE